MNNYPNFKNFNYTNPNIMDMYSQNSYFDNQYKVQNKNSLK